MSPPLVQEVEATLRAVPREIFNKVSHHYASHCCQPDYPAMSRAVAALVTTLTERLRVVQEALRALSDAGECMTAAHFEIGEDAGLRCGSCETHQQARALLDRIEGQS